MLSRLRTAVLLALLAAGGASCSSARFERAWEASAATEACTRWEGEWRSAWNGHSGGLRGLLERCGEQHVHIWFLSTYARILSFQHATHFHLTPQPDGSFVLAGAQDLGALVGGVYRYEGALDAQHFRATYTAENGDHGVFEMRRVE